MNYNVALNTRQGQIQAVKMWYPEAVDKELDKKKTSQTSMRYLKNEHCARQGHAQQITKRCPIVGPCTRES